MKQMIFLELTVEYNKISFHFLFFLEIISQITSDSDSMIILFIFYSTSYSRHHVRLINSNSLVNSNFTFLRYLT